MYVILTDDDQLVVCYMNLFGTGLELLLTEPFQKVGRMDVN